jgi:hypothetical protein
MKLGFGVLFSVNKESALREGRIDVVIDPERGENDYFYCAQITDEGTGPQWSLLTGIGTASRREIDQIVGRMSLEEMLAAAALGSLRVAGRELTDKEKRSVFRFSRIPDRELPE